MPLDVTTPLVFGGIISSLSKHLLTKRKASPTEIGNAERNGMLFASGLIAGEAMVGILLAIPFVLYQSTSVFSIVPDALKNSTDVLGVIVTMGMLIWFYNIATKTK